MSQTFINNCSVTLHNISTKLNEKVIINLIKKYFPHLNPRVNFGDSFIKNGREMYRVYVKLNKVADVNEIMRNRNRLQLNSEPVTVTRTLPKTCPLYDRCVTGVKVRIHPSTDKSTSTTKLKESDLRNYFQHFGQIRHCEWTNENQTEALFAFTDYDSVDQIISNNASPIIKGISINFEKTYTEKDYIAYECPYVIHVTDLPLRVTSEEVSKHFGVPSAVILLYPCFRAEQAYITHGRSSSEGWIKYFSDEKSAQRLAEEKTGTLLGPNRIHCEAMLEPIDDPHELCERFQEGQCPYTMDTCYYKHFSCSQRDTCEDTACWYGHSMKRKTKSISRTHSRSEDAQYRARFGNLPYDITREVLIARLKIDANSAQYLILEPTDNNNSNGPKLAYLTRQFLENKLRRQIDQWQNISFSPNSTSQIQCQLELNQDYFEWNGSSVIPLTRHHNRCASPVLSIQSARSDRNHQAPRPSSTISTTSGIVKKTHLTSQSQTEKLPTTSAKRTLEQKSTTHTLCSKLISAIRESPSDLSSLSPQWQWNGQMVATELFDNDELYPLKESNAFVKIYSPKIDRSARIRARYEQMALRKLTQLNCVPEYINSNIDTSDIDRSKKELWTIMKLSNGERLVDYIRETRLDLREALQLTRRLLSIVKTIHGRNVIHRDIQPKNILVQSHRNNQPTSLMLINFGSSWINDRQAIDFLKKYDNPTGNSFYRMPQFEKRNADMELNENDNQLKQSQRSTTIDTVGCCAILFWIITGHEPKELHDISKNTPHRLRDHPKIIEKKVAELTAFRMEKKIPEHVLRHLMLTFDHCFTESNQQWSVNELDYQLQFILALIDGDKNQKNYFPALRDDIGCIPLPSIPTNDSFIYIVSLIHHLKNYFAARYPNCIRWSMEEKNGWYSQDGQIDHHHSMFFSYQSKELSVDTNWKARIVDNQQISISIEAKDHNKVGIELPLGFWRINNQTNDFDIHMLKFEIEMEILINLLCQSMGFKCD